jgi:hypothetical protein
MLSPLLPLLLSLLLCLLIIIVIISNVWPYILTPSYIGPQLQPPFLPQLCFERMSRRAMPKSYAAAADAVQPQLPLFSCGANPALGTRSHRVTTSAMMTGAAVE